MFSSPTSSRSRRWCDFPSLSAQSCSQFCSQFCSPVASLNRSGRGSHARAAQAGLRAQVLILDSLACAFSALFRAFLTLECCQRRSVAGDKRSKKRGVNVSDGVQDDINDMGACASDALPCPGACCCCRCRCCSCSSSGSGACACASSSRDHLSLTSPSRPRPHPAALAAALSGQRVVRLKSGDPFIYGRGAF